MGYEVTSEDDIEPTTVREHYSKNLETVEDPVERDSFLDLSLLPVDEVLGAEEVQVKLWHFEPGQEITYHAHTHQEELFYILEGEFSLKLGDPDDHEIVEVGPGTFYVAGPEIGHGHRYLGDDTGVVLAIGAPPSFDPGRDPADFTDD